ncbi:MAG: carbohydrate ABC transporter permease [Treponemataceae bacterium]
MKKTKTMMITFLGPAIFAYVLVFLYPTIRTTIMSFFDVKNITDALSSWVFVGFGNYKMLFTEPLFIQSMKNIAGIWFWGGIFIFGFSLFFAIILTSGVKFKSFFRAVIYLPNVISAVAMGTMWIHYVYNPRYGLLKSIFSFLGLEKLSQIQWVAPDNVFGALIIAYSFGMVGYFVLIFMAGIEKIPTDFYEAATLEGASISKKFISITFPLLKDVFRTNIVLWTINAVGFFVWSQIFSPLTAELGTITPMVYMYQNVFGSNTVVLERFVGAGAAVGVLLTIIVVFTFAIINFLFRQEHLEY